MFKYVALVRWPLKVNHPDKFGNRLFTVKADDMEQAVREVEAEANYWLGVDSCRFVASIIRTED